MNISKVFKDYLGDEIYGVTGISTGIQYNYNWKFTKYYPYISTGFQYRMYNADSVLYFSDTWQYSESILSHGISIKSGWGYKVTINKIYISTLLGLQCNYDFTRKTNYFIHYDLFNDLKNHNNNKNMVYVLPVLDLYIGWHL
jgi:hypothetical protein